MKDDSPSQHDQADHDEREAKKLDRNKQEPVREKTNPNAEDGHGQNCVPGSS